MIVGVGSDILEISRIRKASCNYKFMDKCFTEDELSLFKSRKDNASTIAANFCVKEGISKALGTGFKGFSFKDIEVLRDDLGKPFINLYRGAKVRSDNIGITKWFITISHSKDTCVAFVVGEGVI